jgi:hypothetical protein
MVAAAVLIGMMLFAGGFFSYQVFLSKGSQSHQESIPLGGYVVIRAYHADGQLYATWQGHNTLYVDAVNAIAECMSGASSTPEWFDTCSPMTSNVWLGGYVNSNTGEPPLTGTASNTLLPAACSPTGNPPSCTGWQTTGTVIFPATIPNGGSYPYTVNEAGASGNEAVIPFDIVQISPTITANAGDTLVITVTFSIT